MASIDKVVAQFHADNEVVYTLMATVNGQVIAKETNTVSADNLSGLAWVIDQAVEAHAMVNATDKVEADNAVKEDEAIALSREK